MAVSVPAVLSTCPWRYIMFHRSTLLKKFPADDTILLCDRSVLFQCLYQHDWVPLDDIVWQIHSVFTNRTGYFLLTLRLCVIDQFCLYQQDRVPLGDTAIVWDVRTEYLLMTLCHCVTDQFCLYKQNWVHLTCWWHCVPLCVTGQLCTSSTEYL